MAREPTTTELAKVTRFFREVYGNRQRVIDCLNAGRAARSSQVWIDSQGLGVALPRVWNDAIDGPRFANIARRATLLERYVAGLEMRHFYFRLTADGSDIEIATDATSKKENVPPAYSFGIVPLVIALVVGVVLLAGAITTAIAFYMDTRKTEAETKKRIAELDAAAAKAGGDVAARWNAYKKDNAAENDGFFGKLGSNLGILAVVGGVVALAIIGSKTYSSTRRAS
jgi:hypothetical protein